MKSAERSREQGKVVPQATTLPFQGRVGARGTRVDHFRHLPSCNGLFTHNDAPRLRVGETDLACDRFGNLHNCSN